VKKKTASVALKKVRDICASLPDVEEGTHFDSIAWRARTRLFATYRETEGDAQLVLRLEPDHAEALLATDDRFERYARARDAIVVHCTGIKDWKRIRALVEESYRLSAPKRKRAR
jgi:predicted DNA-binding protein (MmcQ/YjbR family)